jgi:hypothetical protein
MSIKKHNLRLSQSFPEMSTFAAQSRPDPATVRQQGEFKSQVWRNQGKARRACKGEEDMTDIVEKARQGRVAALAAMTGKSGAVSSSMGAGARFRSAVSHEKVIFFSARSRRNDGAVFG